MPDASSTVTAARHHHRYHLLVQLTERAVARNPALGTALAAEMAAVMHADPAFAAIFNDQFRQPRRGPYSALATSPLVTAIENTASVSGIAPMSAANTGRVNGNLASVSHNTASEMHNTGSVSSLVISSAAPPRVSPQTPLPSPPKGGKVVLSKQTHIPLRPSDGASDASVEADDGNDGPHRLCFQAVAQFMWPEGSTAGIAPRTRARTAVVAKLMREALTKTGVPGEEQADHICGRLTAERWANTIGSVPKTIANLEKNWESVLFGADVNGRSNGTVRHHSQYLNESATVKHQRPLVTTPD